MIHTAYSPDAQHSLKEQEIISARLAELRAAWPGLSDEDRRLERAGTIIAQRDRYGHRRFPEAELKKLFQYLGLKDGTVIEKK